MNEYIAGWGMRAVGKSWEEALQSYLREWNRTLVEGQGDRLQPFFLEAATWQEEQSRLTLARERMRQQGIKPLGAKMTAIPLYTAALGEDEVATAVQLHQQLYYKWGDEVYRQECQETRPVRLKRRGDDWAFLWPWGWYFEQHHLQDLPQLVKPDEPGGEESAKGDSGDTASGIQPVQQSLSPGRYNRAAAVAYAERYWNSTNPAYRRFQDDCTNFISQCLHAGGIPMVFFGNRSRGWWYRGGRNANWSYSWTVAHSFYLLLKSGKAPFYAVEVPHPAYLEPGDVICYDFDGDGRWQHNTIVVAKDWNNMPLVNAHTTDSRMRYWSYQDSSAYTPRIRYAFFRIQG